MTIEKKILIKSYVEPDEYIEIKEKASQCRISISTFIKKVCLGETIKSKIDQKAILELIKISGDLGRLGGLLKLGIVEGKLIKTEIKPLLDSILKLQNELKQKINKL